MIIIKTAGAEAYLEGGSGRLKFLLTGIAGTGKTRFLGFAPRPLIAACEEGILSVADLGTPYATIRSEEDMNAFLTFVETENAKPADQRRFDTVGIDTVDAYERSVINNYLRKMRKKEMSGFEDWGYLAAVMTDLMARLFRLDMNIVMLAHTKSVTRDGQTPKDQIVLKLKGDVGQQLPNDFDFVGMIETDFVAGEEGREIQRSIRWESTPAVQWLKFRGKGVRTTPLTFDKSDFDAIRQAIVDGAKNAAASQEIERVETPADVSPPVAPGPGVALPVAKRATAPVPAAAPPVAAAPQPAAAPQAAPQPAPQAAPPAQAPVPAAVAPVPAAPRPDPTPPVESTEQAVANVKAAMPGSTVVSDSTGQLPAETPTATPVAEPEAAAVPAPEQADNPEQPEAAEGSYPAIPADGAATVQCGTPRFPDTPPKGTVPGCGKELTITMEDSRIVGVEPAGENAQFLEMAALRERAVLCNACFRDARTQSGPSVAAAQG